MESEVVSQTGNSRRVRRSVLGTLTAVAVVGAVATTAWATIPSSGTGIIHSCYNATANPSGSMRIIDVDNGGKCTKTEKALDFNQSGPTGAQGLPGATGPSGATGATGPAGIDGKDGADGADGADGSGGTGDVHQAYNGLFGGPISVSVPAGSYLVQGYASVFADQNSGFTAGYCTVYGSIVTDLPVITVDDQVVPIMGTVQLGAPGVITMDCGGTNVATSYKRMFVTPVASIING